MKKIILFVSVGLLFSCGKSQETASGMDSSNDTASIVMLGSSNDYIKVLDATMNSLAEKNVAGAVSAYTDSVQFIHPSGVITKTKSELETALTSRIKLFSSLSYTGRTYIAFDVRKPSQKNVNPGVYVTGWMWSTVKNAKGDSVVTPMTLTIHFNKENKVDFGYSTYDLKGRSDLLSK